MHCEHRRLHYGVQYLSFSCIHLLNVLRGHSESFPRYCNYKRGKQYPFRRVSLAMLTFGLLGLLVGISCLRLTSTTARSIHDSDAADSLIRTTTSGRVQGFLDVNTTGVPLNKWLGVRYAADTSGRNRWRPPQPVVVPGVFDASAYGPACLQGR